MATLTIAPNAKIFIENGPSKWDMMLSLLNGTTLRNWVTLKLKDINFEKGEVRASFERVQRSTVDNEDSWNVIMRLRSGQDLTIVEGTYNTATRTGWIERIIP